MADFVAVLRKTLEGLGETTPEIRARVYDKARSTVQSKLAALNPPPPPAVADRQRKALEEAIASVESEYAPAKPAFEDPLEELESVFAALKEGKPLAASKAPPPKPAAGAALGVETAAAAAPARSAAAAPAKAVAAAALDKPAATTTAKATTPAPAKPNGASAPAARANGAVPQRSAPAFQAPVARREPTLPPPDESPFLDEPIPADEAEEETAAAEEAYPHYEERRRGRSYGGAIAAAVLAVLVLGGAGYGVWLNRDEFGKILDVSALMERFGKPAATEPASTEPAQQTDVASSENAQTPAANGQAEPEQPQKFTQRLNADGTETDAGPGGSQQAFGEGTSVASLTAPPAAGEQQAPPPVSSAPQPGTEAAAPPAGDNAPAASEAPPPAADAATAPAADAQTPPGEAATPPPAPAAGQAGTESGAPAAATPDAAAQTPPASGQPAGTEATTAQQVAVGQRAIFYEERTSTAQGSAESGSIVWSQVQESPGGDLPPEPAIRAEATIPGKDIQLRLTIRRNADKTLPASHIVEMIFLTPEGFEGGGIDNVLRIALKTSEQDAGNPLLGIPAKIADGFFLIALNDTKNEIDTNLGLLRQRSWIDIPIVYKNGRRALITMEKGIPGEKVFDDTLKAWEQQNTAG